MGDSTNEKEKVRHRVRLHMYQALAVGAVGGIVLGSTVSGCQSQSNITSQSQALRDFQVVCDPLPPPKRSLKTTVQFDFGKATLNAYDKAKLDEVVARLKGLSLEVAIVSGHADRIGPKAVNRKLSEQRAASVKAYLIVKGLESNRIYTEGNGLESPATKPNECKGQKSKQVITCLQPDRRVDIEIIAWDK